MSVNPTVGGPTPGVPSPETMLKAETGHLAESLLRNNRQIKADRAMTIISDLKKQYKRKIEDLVTELERFHMSREAIIDALSPNTATTNVIGVGFDSGEFVEGDEAFLKNVWERETRIKGMVMRYRYLFGNDVDVRPPLYGFMFEDADKVFKRPTPTASQSV